MSIVLDMYIVTWPPVIPLPFPYGKCLIINMMQLYSCQVTNNELIVLQCGVLGLGGVLTRVLIGQLSSVVHKSTVNGGPPLPKAT